MKNSRMKYNILIIDDHPIIIEGYKNAIEYFNQTNSEIEFEVESATSIDIAIQKTKKSISSNKVFDLVILDISLPESKSFNIKSGEYLGIYIKNLAPKIKTIVITALNDNIRLVNIFSNLRPQGLLIKSDITGGELIRAIKTVVEGSNHLSKSMVDLLHLKTSCNFKLDNLDLNILIELSNGAKMKDLQQIIPLTKSGIEKRKRNLKSKFKILSNSDRDLVLAAKRKGFI